MPTSKKAAPHGTASGTPTAFTGAEILAAFSAAVAAGRSAQEAVKLIAPLVRGKVTLLVQVVRGGTRDGAHTVAFRLTNPTAHGIYLRAVELASPADVPVATWTHQPRTMSYAQPAEGLRRLDLPAHLEPGSDLELWCSFDAAETRKRIFNLGYAKMKFVCDAMDAMDPAETVVGFRLRDGAP
jgi:hypothetical protein